MHQTFSKHRKLFNPLRTRKLYVKKKEGTSLNFPDPAQDRCSVMNLNLGLASKFLYTPQYEYVFLMIYN